MNVVSLPDVSIYKGAMCVPVCWDTKEMAEFAMVSL